MEDSFIKIRELYKTFHGRNADFAVLKGIDLNISKGDIFGIVGFSGAGKTTLRRCLNRLETPDRTGYGQYVFSADGYRPYSISDAEGKFVTSIVLTR
jgi:ABC-type oligopeptide transport system ATPase subunit